MKLLIAFFTSQQKVPRDAALQSSHKPTFKKAISQNAQNSQIAVFAPRLASANIAFCFLRKFPNT